MHTDDPFKVLDIPIDSSPEEIKMAFRSLLFKYHPDTSGNQSGNRLTDSIVKAYKEAIRYSEKRERIDNEKFKKRYFSLFNIEYQEITDIGDIFHHLKIIFTNLNHFFFSKREFGLLREYVIRLYKSLNGFEDSQIRNFSQTITFCLEFLVDSRETTLEKLFENEYTFEKIRMIIIGYFREIFTSRDYINFRYSIFSPLESIGKDIAFYLKKSLRLEYKQELFAMFLLVTIISNEEFVELIYSELLGEEG